MKLSELGKSKGCPGGCDWKFHKTTRKVGSDKPQTVQKCSKCRKTRTIDNKGKKQYR
tara:strand:- start:82 stop:252 length:171 start_codon:yes stop_codon:yes gene_type:complete